MVISPSHPEGWIILVLSPVCCEHFHTCPAAGSNVVLLRWELMCVFLWPCRLPLIMVMYMGLMSLASIPVQNSIVRTCGLLLCILFSVYAWFNQSPKNENQCSITSIWCALPHLNENEHGTLCYEYIGIYCHYCWYPELQWYKQQKPLEMSQEQLITGSKI